MTNQSGDKKLDIILKECKKTEALLSPLIKKIYAHAIEHPNQELDVMSYEIKRIIDETLS